MARQPNLLTVDLEEWYVVEILQNRFSFEEWPGLNSTLQRNVRRLLTVFDQHQVRATWFVLGWCAERLPALIDEIAERGHEIACHSFAHKRVDSMSEELFRADTTRAIKAIENATGVKPRGYRAPSWSINENCSWAFRVLSELGFQYDSSIFPIKHDLYGMPSAPRRMFKMTFEDGRTLWEVPSVPFRLLGFNLPMAGGGYLRHSPYWYTKMMIRLLNGQNLPAMVYMHPWELDPEPPEIPGLTAVQRFRTYGSTALFLQKLDKLLRDFEFMSIGEYVNKYGRRRIGFESTHS
ncbi:polysaccharide deacetylase family protein [candidate division GN15 bacterium]|uniref:Polysaccharide deacetylase family protein n=1 Tax=candidate division GN15 bacterium TaxID=2072418 RepID=A0A855WTH6_9BACT|nr:MAG: polysaccharide deacetylase family protein [candidate division GN15 bacterium]